MLVAFSAVVSCSILIGKHIQITGSDYPSSNYRGTNAENYIASFGVVDLFAFVGIALVVAVFALRLYAWLLEAGPSANNKKFEQLTPPNHFVRLGRLTRSIKYRFRQIPRRIVLAYLLVLFVAWMPYLVAYYPGFVFGDAIVSLDQAIGGAAWINNHPVFFMLLLKAAMKAMCAIGFGRTAGLALYSVCQMLCYGCVFAYLVAWLKTRLGVHSAFCWVILAIFALSPYVATYSVAFWKDPLFTSAAIVLSLMLADVAFSRCAPRVVTWRFLFVLTLDVIFMSLMRNNGIYIAIAVLFMVGLFWFFVWRKNIGFSGCCARGLAASLAFAIAVSWAITGPLYTAIGVQPTETVERVGIALNQMARVAAVGGDMTEADAEYLDSILPLGQYAEKYRPCCTDMLKWDEEFSDEALDAGDFWGHWWSMLIRNPTEYVKAWIMQTYGFWTFNEPSVVSCSWNISHGGLPTTDQLACYDIYLSDYRQGNMLQQLFPYDNRSLPEGLLFWALLYLALVMCLRGKWSWLLALVPSGALMLTLFIASPAWY